MKEQHKLIGALTVAATVAEIAIGARQNQGCNDVLWRKESNGHVSGPTETIRAQELQIRQHRDALLGIEITSKNGKKIKDRTLTQGNLTICPRNEDTLITHRDGREWKLSITNTIDAIRIGEGFLAVSYWAEQKETYNANVNKREVMVIRPNGETIVLEDIASPTNIQSVTDEEIIYHYGTQDSYEMRARYKDGKELILEQENW